MSVQLEPSLSGLQGEHSVVLNPTVDFKTGPSHNVRCETLTQTLLKDRCKASHSTTELVLCMVMFSPVCIHCKVLLGFCQFIFGSAVSIFDHSVDYQCHQYYSTTRKPQVGQSQLTLARLLPTEHMPPHTNHTRHMLFLFCQATEEDWSRHLSRKVEQTRPILEVKPKNLRLRPHVCLRYLVPILSGSCCVGDRFMKNENKQSNETTKKSPSSMTCVVRCFLFRFNVAVDKHARGFCKHERVSVYQPFKEFSFTFPLKSHIQSPQKMFIQQEQLKKQTIKALHRHDQKVYLSGFITFQR